METSEEKILNDAILKTLMIDIKDLKTRCDALEKKLAHIREAPPVVYSPV